MFDRAVWETLDYSHCLREKLISLKLFLEQGYRDGGDSFQKELPNTVVVSLSDKKEHI